MVPGTENLKHIGENLVFEMNTSPGSFPSNEKPVVDKDTSDDSAVDTDPKLHTSWRVALYYYYVDLSNVPEHVEFHRRLCEGLSLNGRIRISSEGLNGVLTGLFCNLKQYEDKVMEQLQEVCPNSSLTEPIDLDVKYCLLREDLPSKSTTISELVLDPMK